MITQESKTHSHTAASLRGSVPLEPIGCDSEPAVDLHQAHTHTSWCCGEFWEVVRQDLQGEKTTSPQHSAAFVRCNEETGAIEESAQMLLQVLALKGNSRSPLGAFSPTRSFNRRNVHMIFGIVPIPPGVSKGRTTNMGNI